MNPKVTINQNSTTGTQKLERKEHRNTTKKNKTKKRKSQRNKLKEEKNKEELQKQPKKTK